MKNFKRSNLTTVLLTIFLLAISTNQAQANMFNRFREGFYFEKYSPKFFKPAKAGDKKISISEARVALLGLHPIGSDSSELFKTLDKAGAQIQSEFSRNDLKSYHIHEREYFPSDVSKSASVVHHYQYDTGIWLINPITWSILVFCDDNNSIIDIHLGRDYSGL